MFVHINTLVMHISDVRLAHVRLCLQLVLISWFFFGLCPLCKVASRAFHHIFQENGTPKIFAKIFDTVDYDWQDNGKAIHKNIHIFFCIFSHLFVFWLKWDFCIFLYLFAPFCIQMSVEPWEFLKHKLTNKNNIKAFDVEHAGGKPRLHLHYSIVIWRTL